MHIRINLNLLFGLCILCSCISERKNSQSNQHENLTIPPRSNQALKGSEMMLSLQDLDFDSREAMLLEELSKGNIPDFLRKLVPLEGEFEDLEGKLHQVKIWVMPDYLSLGSDDDFCRIPISPKTAQLLADQYGAMLPTRKIVDFIYTKGMIHLEPVTYFPVGDENERVKKFMDHQEAIQMQFEKTDAIPGMLTVGTKKDIVISNKISDRSRPDHVVIYGWHRLDGSAIQPLSNIHYGHYVDYSHGARLMSDSAILDGEVVSIDQILRDKILFKVLSDEDGPMKETRYNTD